jgi:hypothetical protein
MSNHFKMANTKKKKKIIQGIGWKCEGKRSLLRHMHSLEYNIEKGS